MLCSCQICIFSVFLVIVSLHEYWSSHVMRCWPPCWQKNLCALSLHSFWHHWSSAVFNTYTCTLCISWWSWLVDLWWIMYRMCMFASSKKPRAQKSSRVWCSISSFLRAAVRWRAGLLSRCVESSDCDCQEYMYYSVCATCAHLWSAHHSNLVVQRLLDTVSIHQHRLCRTTLHLNWKTATLVERSSRLDLTCLLFDCIYS